MNSISHDSNIVNAMRTDRKKRLVENSIRIIDYNKYIKGVDRADRYFVIFWNNGLE